MRQSNVNERISKEQKSYIRILVLKETCSEEDQKNSLLDNYKQLGGMNKDLLKVIGGLAFIVSLPVTIILIASPNKICEMITPALILLVSSFIILIKKYQYVKKVKIPNLTDIYC